MQNNFFLVCQAQKFKLSLFLPTCTLVFSVLTIGTREMGPSTVQD